MTCEQAMELLSPMLDGEPDPQLSEALEAHLEACPDCKALADSLRGLDVQLAGLKEPAPESLKRGVLYKIDQATGKAKKPRSRWFGPGTAIGAVAAVLVLLVGVGVIPLKGRSMSSASKPAAEDYVASPETEVKSNDGLAPELIEDNKHGFYYLPSSGQETGALSESPIAHAGTDGMNVREPDSDAAPADHVQDTWYRSGNASGEENPRPVSDEVRKACSSLSTKEKAAVLLYTEFDFKSIYSLLAREQPELSALLEKLEPEERDGLIVFKTDCNTTLAVHEWILEHLPRSEFMDAGTAEAESNLRMRMEKLDPGCGSLYKVITWAPPDHPVTWPEDWPVGWAVRIRTEENWALFFPREDYTPNEKETAYLAFLP